MFPWSRQPAWLPELRPEPPRPRRTQRDRRDRQEVGDRHDRRGRGAARIDWSTGVWLERPPRKICSIGVHISRWVTTHGYALNVDLDPAPFTEWITACGLEGAAFTTTARELSRDGRSRGRPIAAVMLGEVFDLELEELPRPPPRT